MTWYDVTGLSLVWLYGT